LGQSPQVSRDRISRRRGRARLALIAIAAGLALAATAGATTAWRAADPAYGWSFPRDHWAHPGYRTEWWYVTGHLVPTDDPARRFGYQFTLFRVGLLAARPDGASAWSAANLVVGHAAVSDLAAGRHRFGELLYREMPFLGGFGRFPDPRIAWSRGPAGTDGTWTLDWNGEAFDVAATDRAQGFAFRLSTRPVKPLVLQGPNGLSRKGEGVTAASLYYSFTRLRTEGTLALDGRSWTVRGESWMDKEFGSNQLGGRQVGWDWFGLQLADGRELMLYLLRRRDGAVDFARGTLVSAAGAPRYLEPGDWRVSASRTWTSSTTGARYPARWAVELPSERLALEIVPELPDQENRSRLVRDLHYWEGAVAARGPDGVALGRGYVELVGYGTRAIPAM
jgi:predicted secreted hydrolase